MKKGIISSILALFLLAPAVFASATSAENGIFSAKNQEKSLVECQNPLSEETSNPADSLYFGQIYNKEYDVTIHFDFIKQDILVPGQDILGKVAGYIKYSKDSRVWLIMDVEIDKKKNICTMEIINDYGSEDLTATLSYDPKTQSFTFINKHGSTIKFAKNNKWMKLPSKLIFERKEK